MRAASRCRAVENQRASRSDVCVDRSKEELLAQVFGECDQSPHFKEMTAVKFGWWPLIVVASLGHWGYLIIFLGATLGAAAFPRLVACPRAQLKEKKRP